MAGQKLSYTINLDGTSKTIGELRRLRAEILKAIDIPTGTSGLDAAIANAAKAAAQLQQANLKVEQEKAKLAAAVARSDQESIKTEAEKSKAAQASAKAQQEALKIESERAKAAQNVAKAEQQNIKIETEKSRAAQAAARAEQQLITLAAQRAKAAQGVSIDVPDNSPGLDSLLGKVPQLAFAYNQVTQSVQGLLTQLKPVYDLLIGANEDLNQQLLQSAGTIVATSKVVQNGVEIKDPTAAIKALTPLLEREIKKVEVATQNLVGVTSQQTSEVFNTILSNVGLLNSQLNAADGSGKQFASSLEAASALTPGLVATLGTLKIPIFQANQEIRSLLSGVVDQNSAVAKAIGITPDELARYKQAGTLASSLVQRFDAFVKANALAARSVAGITSNIQDIVELTGRAAGAPLLTVLVDQLDAVYQALKANQGQITETATDAVAVIANLLKTTLESLNTVFQALTPSLNAIGAAIADAFGAGAETAGTTIENLTSIITTTIQVATPFIQLLSSLASGIAEISSTPAGQNLIQFGLAVAGVNAVIPVFTSGLSAALNAVGALESTFNNLLPILAQTNIAKTGLTAKEVALAIATGTTTAATNAQALAQARLTVGDYAGAAAATEMAAAEQAKAISLQQSAGAIAGNIAKLGLLAAAVGSVAIAVNEFQDITKEAQNTQKGVEDINSALAKLDEARAAANATNAQGAQATQEAVAANVALIQAGLNPVTQTLDKVIGFINQVTAQFNTLLKSPAAEFIPGLREVKLALNAIGQEGFPELSTAAEAAVSQAQGSFSDLKVTVDGVFQDLGASIKKADGTLQFPNLTGKSKEELDAYTASVNRAIAVLEASRPTNAADLKYKNDNVKALKAAKEAIDAATNSTTIQSATLTSQGTIYENLNAKVKAAQATLAEGAPAPETNAAAKTLTELIQQQVELGQVSAEQAQKVLESIARDGRVELETRQSAQSAIAKIQETATQQRIAQFQAEQGAIDRLQAEGVINDAEAEKRRTANKQKELQAQLDSVREAVAAEEKAISEGRGSKTRLDQLKKQEIDLVTQTAQAKASAEKASLDKQLQDLQRYLDQATSATEQAETERQIRIQSLVNQGVVSQKEADRLKAESNQQSLQAQLKAEQAYLAKLRALPSPSDPDEREAQEKRVRESIQKTGQLQLQLLQAEQQAQEAVRQVALDAIKDQREAIQNNLELSKAATFAAIQGIQEQQAILDRQKSTYEAINSSLDQQKNLLQSRQGLQDALNGLVATEAKIRIDGLTEGLDLSQRLQTEQDAGVKAVIRQRLQALGISGSEEQIQRRLAVQQQQEAQATLVRLAQKQQFDRISLDLQLQQEQAQKRSAVIEAQRNQLAAQRQAIEAKLAVANAVAAQQDAQAQLQEAQLTQDPAERRRAIAAAQRQQSQADRDLLNAQQQSQLANEGVGLANQQVDQAQAVLKAQAEIVNNSRAALQAQQQSESAVAKQAADSTIFAANLAQAEASARAIGNSLGSGGTAPIPRRTGGDAQSGQLYFVHKDEMFVPSSNGYVLNRADAMKVAQQALSTGTGATLGGVRSVSAANAGNAQILSTLQGIQASLRGLKRRIEPGVSINNLSQSITNQVPRDAAAIARQIEEGHLSLIRDLKNIVKGMN